jgi:invasion protein IalB
MLQTTRTVFLALLLATATGVSAQETTTEEAPAAEAPAEEAPAAETPAEEAPAEQAGGELSLGTPLEQAEAAAGPRVGEPYFLQVFGSWAHRCLKAEEGETDPCQLYQLLRDGDGNTVAEISLFPLPDGTRAAAGATIVAPLETLLTQALTLRIDGGEPRQYPFTFCNAAGCVSRIGFTAEEITAFKRGAKATLRMVPAAAPDQEVILDIPLDGFTAGYDGLEVIPE